ncbi:MAG: hypothetical protein ACXVYV_07515 [Gaiellales bacterium]
MNRTYVRRIGLPRAVAVQTDQAGRPVAVGGRSVEHVRDEWRVDEGWWTRRPVRRRYFDLVLADGRNTVVFCDRRRRRWFTQRA